MGRQVRWQLMLLVALDLLHHPVLLFFALTITAVGVSHSSALAPDTNKAKHSATSMFEILDSKPAIDSSSDEGTTLDTVKGEIELQPVSFCYPTRPNHANWKALLYTRHYTKALEDLEGRCYCSY